MPDKNEPSFKGSDGNPLTRPQKERVRSLRDRTLEPRRRSAPKLLA